MKVVDSCQNIRYIHKIINKQTLYKGNESVSPFLLA